MEKENKKLTKKAKGLIALGVALCVVIIGVIVYFTNSTAINNYVLYMFMPKTITASEINTNYDLGVRLNEDYDAKKQKSQPLEAFEYYYTDPETGKEVVVKGADNAKINGEDVPIYLGFLIRAKTNMNSFKSILSKVLLVVVPVLIAVGIVLWFKAWSKKQDEEKQMKYKSNNKK